MKASQFSDAQKAFILKQGDEGHPVAGTDVLPFLFALRRRVFPLLSRYPSLDHRKLEFPAFGQQRAGSAVGF